MNLIKYKIHTFFIDIYLYIIYNINEQLNNYSSKEAKYGKR